MKFEHYILTRFNLPLLGIDVCEDKKVDACSEQYLSYRMHLFENYCLPSIKKQTNQNFKWLLLLDINTPEVFRKRFDYLHDYYPNLIPCYLDIFAYSEIPSVYTSLCQQYEDILGEDANGDDIESSTQLRQIIPLFVRDCISKCSNENVDYYITTRLDSDDALHCEMISDIQKRFIHNPGKKFYDYVYSYKYILNEGVVYRYSLLNGHFVSLSEPTTEVFQSVLFWNHLFINRFLNVEHIYTKPFQTELIHGGNVVNGFTELTISGILYALLHFHKKDFGFNFINHSYKRMFHILAFLIKESIKC